MAKRQGLEDTLAELRRVRAAPTTPEAIGALRAALAGKNSHAVATAAQVAAEAEIEALVPDLVSAFDRFTLNPLKTDPGCRAKADIAEALYRIGADCEALFLRGVRYVQMEPVWGGREDSAGGLRASCALGLVRMNSPRALDELADLLADRDVTVRVAAARAVAYSGDEHGAPLLRLKILTGDEDPRVTSEAMQALLQLSPESGLGFVGRLLDADDRGLSEAAALAIGGSRRREGFPILRDWWQRAADLELRRVGLLAIAMLRQDEPLNFLVSLIAEAPGPTARDAIDALGLYRDDDALRRRVTEVSRQREDADLTKALAKAFP